MEAEIVNGIEQKESWECTCGLAWVRCMWCDGDEPADFEGEEEE
jgi:hypothetical protein